MRVNWGLGGLMFSATTLAGEVERSYVPPSPAVSSGSVVQMLLSLMLVLAVIVLVAWMLKRANVSRQGQGGLLKVLGGVAIGQRERIVLVELNDTWLVVGVGPGQIRMLHTLVKPDGVSQVQDVTGKSMAKQPDFASILASVWNSVSKGKPYAQ